MPAHKKTELWSILRDDNSLFTYSLTKDDVYAIQKSADAGKIFAMTSIGMIKLSDIRHMVKYKPPKEQPKNTIPPAPALPLMDDDELREVLRVHYADQPREVVEAWLTQLKGEDLISAAEYAATNPL